MTTLPPAREPETLAESVALIRQRDIELARAREQLAHARQELEDTNRGLIALYTELQAAREAEGRLAAVVQSSDDAIISMTTDCLVQTWNPGADRLLGHAEDEIFGRLVTVLMHAESKALLALSLDKIREGQSAQRYDTQWRRADGSMVDVAVNVFALRDIDGELIGFSAVARDITTQVEAQRQLERLARYDTLTGLVNRTETLSRLDIALQGSRTPGTHLGVLFCDIDRFKAINDTWGHAVGDTVLTTVAGWVRDCVRDADTVGRIGGDELLVLLSGIHSLDELAEIAEHIRQRAGQPIHHAGNAIRVTLSIGATLAIPGESVTAMTARADSAMYQAKRTGRDAVIRI
jgi:diguanylate cyclase (GGDEF)-like protein/PAS domain S-box-containing protein